MSAPAQRASHQARAARTTRRPPSFAAVLVALAIVCALAWMFFLRAGEPSSAPIVRAIEGTYAWTQGSGNDSLAENGAFSAVASGNAGGKVKESRYPARYDSRVHELESAYDAETRTETTTSRQIDGPPAQTVDEWPPAWLVATRSPLDYQGLAAVVRSAVEDGDDAVGIKPVKDGDRAVWRAAVTLGGKEIDLVVDQNTGLVTWYTDGDGTFTATVNWDSPPPADETYTVSESSPATAKTTTRAVEYAATPADAGRAAGFDPLVSSQAPDGFELTAVATIDNEGRPADWLGVDPSSLTAAATQPVVAQLSTRGLSWFTMEQIGPQAVRAYGAALRDAATSSGRLALEQTTLQYGAFRGATASTWYQESGPSLFVAGERRAVFVTGALTRQELVAFAEGLKPAAE